MVINVYNTKCITVARIQYQSYKLSVHVMNEIEDAGFLPAKRSVAGLVISYGHSTYKNCSVMSGAVDHAKPLDRILC